MKLRKRPAALVNRSAVVERLCAVLPSTIAPWMAQHGRCIAATRIGVEALWRFGIVGVPLAVDVQAFNPAAVAWILDGSPGGGAEFKRRGCYYLTSKHDPGAETLPPTRPRSVRGWDGHLVVHVPALGRIVDFDARQLSRPEFGLVTLDAWAMPWHPVHGAEAVCEDGARVVYTPRDDETWRDAPDWTRDPGEIVAEVVAAARARR